ncbi:trehalose 6-phosphate synthase [Bradyrhizobium sp. USDA 4532]|nr:MULTISPECIES: trehalose-6-phosphate synthase [unclassified Bradyrhizobium]MCP1835383.1 trehalose 6-phosphate synthase [Bradyrhizobium sp. USDA 4545]MCP1920129.1 trehalose 6-phosphate synthase [Bradyrhizobium sp. USDA 4532]
MNLVVVSNRVAGSNALEPRTGGLEAALVPVVQQSGAIWVGPRRPSEAEPLVVALGGGKLVRVDLPAEDYHRYYEGFSNSELWPALHSLTERVSSSPGGYNSYRKINALMADALLEYRDRDAFWVHDYHFLTLGAEMRDRGVDRPIGFFLHTPWPPPDVQLGPHRRELIESMLAYDLVGFQTDEDRQNFLACVRADLDLTPSEDGVVIAHRGGITRCQVFPIGIDTEKFAQYAADASSNADVSSLLEGLDREKLAVGVDRLDYTKGLDNRVRAINHALNKDPRSICLLQIATISRSGIKSYDDYQQDVARLVDDVNVRHGADGWVPIRHETKPQSQPVLAGLYRAARVGVVTSLRDGMNLVAKEYVAAQDPSKPGVLVLSKYAGAAKELDGALLIDPNDIEDIAEKIAIALSMSLPKRICRWEKMMAKLREYPIQKWSAHFISELEKIRTEKLATQSPRDVGESSSSKQKVEGKLAGGLSHFDLPGHLPFPAFGVRARIRDEDFEPHVGLGGQQGPQPRMSATDLSPWVPLGFDHGVRSVSVPDSVRDELVRSGSPPRSSQPSHLYVHGRAYAPESPATRRRATLTNPSGTTIALTVPVGAEPYWSSSTGVTASLASARGASSSAMAGPGEEEQLPDFGDVVGDNWTHSDWHDGKKQVPAHLEDALRERGRLPTARGEEVTIFQIHRHLYAAELKGDRYYLTYHPGG